MTVRPLSREEVRGIDREAAGNLGLPTLVLMENAGRGAAECLRRRTSAVKVLIVCGPGNNGGDGGVVARHLDFWGYAVKVVWFCTPDQIRNDAAVQYTVLSKAGIDQREWGEVADQGQLDALIADADWVVDGLLGTGLTRPV